MRTRDDKGPSHVGGTMDPSAVASQPARVEFRGGVAGALLPLGVFLAGVAWLGLSGAPDERGFWPILLAAQTTGLVLARRPREYADAMLDGMSQRIVMVMVMAWMLAGVFGSVMSASGLVQALVGVARDVGLSGGGFTAAVFVICCVVSTSTGTSLGTILLCAPLLFPAAGALGSHPAVVIGAIVAGSTFGDNISPVSDTTIASATTQGADLGGVVRSRLRYAIPAAALALVAYALLGGTTGAVEPPVALSQATSPRSLSMLAAPAVAIGLLLAKRHLLQGLFSGIVVALAVALGLGLLSPGELLYVDRDAYIARGLILTGMERAVGVSVFTLLLMGLIGGFEKSGVLDDMVHAASSRVRTPRGAEGWIVTVVSAAVLLTTHSVVAILAVGRFTKETGARFGIGAYRRANLLDMMVCTYPFLLPFFIPTILAASTTAVGKDVGLPRISALEAGALNFYSWLLLLTVVVAVVSGWGRGADSPSAPT
jgi:Na+/H+ antiporter NhaC